MSCFQSRAYSLPPQSVWVLIGSEGEMRNGFLVSTPWAFLLFFF